MTQTVHVDAEPVDHYRVHVVCPTCGRRLHHVNARQPGEIGRSAMAIMRCETRACPEWELRVELITCGREPLTPR